MIHLRHHEIRILMVALGLSAILGCTELLERPDILVITLDTTRADRFSYASDSPVPTPRIDALTAESSAFLDTVAPAPMRRTGVDSERQ